MTKGVMVEHHVKYKELHGVDETVWMTQSEHKKSHHKFRGHHRHKLLVINI